MATSRYTKARKRGLAKGDRNFCGPIALSIACRVPYNKAYSAAKKAGRKDRHGMWLGELLAAAKDLGCDSTKVFNKGNRPLRQPNGSKYTPKTIGKRLKHGYYICMTADHFFAVVNGVVEDWSDSNNLHIKYAFRITVPRGSRS